MVCFCCSRRICRSFSCSCRRWMASCLCTSRYSCRPQRSGQGHCGPRGSGQGGRRAPGQRVGPPHLLLLPHDLQLLGQLDLALALRLLSRAAQLLPVLLPQGTQRAPGIADLRQLVLQPLVVHWGDSREPLAVTKVRVAVGGALACLCPAKCSRTWHGWPRAGWGRPGAAAPVLGGTLPITGTPWSPQPS